MITYTLKRKLFFDYGITSKEISAYAKQNKMKVGDAYAALKQQRSQAGVGVEAFKQGDKSTIKGADLRANIKNRVKNPRQSATVAGQASTKFNKAYNVGLNTGKTQGFQQGQNSVGLMGGLKNTWNNAGTLGKAGIVTAGVGTAALAAKGIASMFGGRKRRRRYEDDY